jgi:hypothetical protein
VVDQAKRFEIAILRPLQIVLVVSAVVVVFKGMWWWLAGCGVGALYLGIVGSKLHPLQPASDLAQAPFEGPAARIESEVFPTRVRQVLVGHACTRVGILVGIAGGAVSWAGLGLAWYWAIVVAWFTMILIGASLKLAFKTVME